MSINKFGEETDSDGRKTRDVVGSLPYIQGIATKKYVDNLMAENVGKGNISGAGSPFFKENDSFKATQAIDMRFKKLLNLSVPSNSSDAVTKNYVDNVKSILNEDINSLSREVNEKIDNVLHNVSEPQNPQDAVSKEFVDKISSILNANIIRLSQLYFTLSSSQDENKEEIGKIKEIRRDINEIRREVNEKIDTFKREWNEKYGRLIYMIKRNDGLLTSAKAKFTGVLKKDGYQFSFYGGCDDNLQNGWCKMKYNCKVEHLTFDSPLHYTENSHRYDFYRFVNNDRYTTLIRPFFQIQVYKNQWEDFVLKTYMCNLFYEKKEDEAVDPTQDEVKKIIIFDNLSEYPQFDCNIFIEKGSRIGIQTLLPYPKAYEFLNKEKNKEYSIDFFIRTYPD